jgi:hypothetical protein
MRWEDERYVRVYVRDTVTWKLLPWQAKCLLVVLMRKLDRAGVLDLGKTEPTKAVAAIVEIPLEVVTTGLPALIDSSTLELSDHSIVMPNFIEAQECSMSDNQRKRESRARQRDLARAQSLISHETSRHGDEMNRDRPETSQNRHTRSQVVTPYCAVPSCAVPSLKEEAAPKKAGRRAPKTKEPDVRLSELQKSMAQIFLEEMGEKYGHRGEKDTMALKRLMQFGQNSEIERRWRWSLHESGYPRCATYTELTDKWNQYTGMEPGHEAQIKRFDPNQGIIRSSTYK